MGRPGLSRHRKFSRLARALDAFQPGFGDTLARGALELIWDSAYESGDALLGDADDVEGAARWRGPKGLLCDALAGAGGPGHAGFIEEATDYTGQYQVHDLFDHAPEYVQRRAEREGERRQRGETIRSLRQAAGRKGGLARASKQQASGKQTAGKCQASSFTPAPAPAPAPAQEEAFCAEPVADAPAPAPAPPVASLPCVGKGPPEYHLNQAQVDEWTTAYPGVDVLGEIRKATAWLNANRTRRKTHGGTPRFIVAWLGRAQDSTGHNGHPRVNANAEPEPLDDERWLDALDPAARPLWTEFKRDRLPAHYPDGRPAAIAEARARLISEFTPKAEASA